MSTVNSYTSPQGTGANFEDLSDIAYDISPTATPLMTALGKGEAASGIQFDWTTRALEAASAAGVVEGKALSELTNTAPTRLRNMTQINERVVTITNTQQRVDSAGGWGHADVETARKLKELKRDQEAALLRNQPIVVGDAATARQTRSFVHFLTATTVVGFTPATSETATDHAFDTAYGANLPTNNITMDDFRNAMQKSWAAGGDPRKVFCTDANKMLISGFTGRVNEVVNGNEKKVTYNVTMLETDFGDLEIVPDRFFPTTAVKNDFTLLVDPEYADLAYLRGYEKTQMGIVGDKKSWQIVVEWGLRMHNPSAHSAIGRDYAA